MPAGGAGYWSGDYWNVNYWHVNYWAGANATPGAPPTDIDSISAVGLLGLSTSNIPAEVIKTVIFLIYVFS